MVRTSLVLGIVALALLAFIVFIERGTVSQGERDQRQGRVLDRFVRERLSRLEIQRKGVTTALVRVPDAEAGVELGAWRLDKPYQAMADKDAVDSLIGALEWVNARRTLSNVSTQDIARFGLDKPRYRVAFEVGRERATFSIGSDSPDGSGTYMRIGDAKVVYVIGKDTVEALDHEPSFYYTKELHDGVSIFALHRLTLRDAGGERVIEKRKDFFWLTKPQLMLASDPVLTDMMSALDGLRATRFVSNDKNALATYGLDKPSFDAAVDLKTYDSKDTTKPIDKALRLRVGKPCAGHDAESYVRVDQGAIMCAANADLVKLRKSADELRELRLLALDDSQVHGVSIREGKSELVLSEADGGWSYKIMQDGKLRTEGTADDAAVTDWFKLLHSATIESFMPGGAEPLRDAGIGTVTHVVRFERIKGKEPLELRFGRREAGRVAATRMSDEPFTLWFPERTLDVLSVSAVRFRKARVLTESEGAFTALTVVRKDGTREVVTKETKGYRFDAPTKIGVERSTVDEVVRLVAALEALRFVADAPTAEHGLAKPEVTLQVSFGERRHTLELGAKTEGGRFAKLDSDPAVFVIAEALDALVQDPLAARSALATPIESLAKLRIVHGDKNVEIERKGASFVIVGAPDGATARAETLMRALATLRATRVAKYGKASPAEGMAQPLARLTVSTTEAEGSKTHELVFGGFDADDSKASIHARRSDMDVDFILSSDALNALLETPQPERAETIVP